MTEKIIRLKPFEVVVKELEYKRRKHDKYMYRSKKCKTGINKQMIHFFGSEIEVRNSHKVGLYSYLHWVINDMWVEKDSFKISELNDLFDIMLEEI